MTEKDIIGILEYLEGYLWATGNLAAVEVIKRDREYIAHDYYVSCVLDNPYEA